MPKKGRGKGETLDPLSLPVELQTALEALYGHYEKTFDLWEEAGIHVPPCFIVVCKTPPSQSWSTTSSRASTGRTKMARRPSKTDAWRCSGTSTNTATRCPAAHAADRQRTTRIRRCAGRELPRHGVRRDRPLPPRDHRAHRRPPRQAENITDQDLLREVMNTVGKAGRLGDSIRCVVSVSMLTEGWDANTVTHVLGVRAFGTQLLCEQVIGRALRRQSYDLNEEGSVQRRICRRARHSLRLHRQAGHRPAAAAARDHPCQGRAPRTRRTGNPFPARRRATGSNCRRNGSPPNSTTTRCWS